MTKQTELTLSLLKKDDVIQRCKDSGIQHLWLFGSYARGEATDESDIDLVYEFSPDLVKNDWGFFDAYQFLEEKTQRKIDLVSKSTLLPTIKKNILHSYISIY